MALPWSTAFLLLYVGLGLGYARHPSPLQRRAASAHGLFTPSRSVPVEGGDSESEVILGHRGHMRGSEGLEHGTLCAYRVLEDGREGRLCFRHALSDFTCVSNDCRRVSSPCGHLVANLLSNGSVLVQWTYKRVGGESRVNAGPQPSQETPTAHSFTPPALPNSPSVGHGDPRGGFRMSCWWNGSYTQFECAAVHLAGGCRDYLLTALHENVPYRICLQPLSPAGGGEHLTRACLDFSVSPTGMQDIVIAMTTVGGAICVMLVIICLLVAYITENIMSSSVQRTLTAQHSRRSHNTHL